ncbi:hypothetical protein DPMN_034252 [Dreissena polymorpha]|uniref:Uncharacterized protein n=1 Tax=Dreissena polymorpha TaxID=45954 RepID=A0A9D4M6G8_DREPO|nr:hypothetical protein DPMN_034252 [Dreissena polymorpha]
MARQRPTRLVMGPCIVEIDRIVIREVQYQLEMNRCRNEEIIVKDNFGWVCSLWAGRPRIDRIVIKEVQYQFEVNQCRNEEIIVKGNFGWAWPMTKIMQNTEISINTENFHPWTIVIREVQYQFEVNRCRNEEIVVNGDFGWAWPMWAWPMWAGRPRIDHIVIREVQYQFEVNRCRNEEIIVKGIFGWAWPMPCIAEIDCIVIREVQYQFEVNRCRNEEIIVKGNFGWALPMWPGRPRMDRIVIREAQYQFEVNRCRNEEVNFQDSSANSVGGAGGQDGHHHNIPTFSPKNMGITAKIPCRGGKDEKTIFHPRRPLPGRLNFEIRFLKETIFTNDKELGLVRIEEYLRAKTEAPTPITCRCQQKISANTKPKPCGKLITSEAYSEEVEMYDAKKNANAPSTNFGEDHQFFQAGWSSGNPKFIEPLCLD